MKCSSLIVVAALALTAACNKSASGGYGSTDTDSDSETDSDTDVDSDTDTDTDADTDTDIDTGSDTDSDTGTDTETDEVSTQLSWAVQAGGNYFDQASALTTFLDGSTAVVGGFYSSTATFGLGEENETVLELPPLDGDDVFVARYNPDGTLAWATRAGGVETDFAAGVANSADESIYVVGAIGAPATFGMEDTPSIDVVEGTTDGYIARFSADGYAQWAKRAGGPNNDTARAVVVTPAGSVVVAGQFRETITLGEGELGEVTLEAGVGLKAVFLASYSEDGTLEWGNQLATYGNPQSVAVTTDGDILVAGYYWGSCTFGPGDLNETTLASSGGTDAFIVRVSSSGELEWAAHGGGANQDHGYDVAVLPDGSAAFVGDFGGTAVFGQDEPGETKLTAASGGEIFVALYGTDGTLSWATHAGGGLEAAGTGVGVTGSDPILVSGTFKGDATFGQGETNETILNAAPSISNMFIASYNEDGSLSWVLNAAGSGIPLGVDLGVDEATNAVLVAGSFEDEVIFGFDEPDETTLEAFGLPGDRDVFVAKYLLP